MIDSFIIDSSTITIALKKSITEKKIALMFDTLQAKDAFTNMINEDFSQDAFYKNWLLINEVKLYSGSFFSSCKTGLLSPMALHIGDRVLIPIPHGLQYIEFP